MKTKVLVIHGSTLKFIKKWKTAPATDEAKCEIADQGLNKAIGSDSVQILVEKLPHSLSAKLPGGNASDSSRVWWNTKNRIRVSPPYIMVRYAQCMVPCHFLLLVSFYSCVNSAKIFFKTLIIFDYHSVRNMNLSVAKKTSVALIGAGTQGRRLAFMVWFS